ITHSPAAEPTNAASPPAFATSAMYGSASPPDSFHESAHLRASAPAAADGPESSPQPASTIASSAGISHRRPASPMAMGHFELSAAVEAEILMIADGLRPSGAEVGLAPEHAAALSLQRRALARIAAAQEEVTPPAAVAAAVSRAAHGRPTARAPRRRRGDRP